MLNFDFKKNKPKFINGEFEWYLFEDIQKKIDSEQANNLPKLDNVFCFIVKSKTICDIVLIDNKQNVIDSKPYNYQGIEEIEVKISMMKIYKHFNN